MELRKYILTLPWLVLVTGFGVAACGNFTTQPARTASPADVREEQRVIVIQAFNHGLSDVHAANPGVKLTISRDPALADESVLLVEYPPPTDDATGRDIWCDAENEDWTAGHAIAFQIKPAQAVKLSVSFFDRNRVAYTTWIELHGGVWQPVRISFDEIRPNPYFQPADAKTRAPLDVTEVKAIAFAPHDQTSGHLAISKFVVIK